MDQTKESGSEQRAPDLEGGVRQLSPGALTLSRTLLTSDLKSVQRRPRSHQPYPPRPPHHAPGAPPPGLGFQTPRNSTLPAGHARRPPPTPQVRKLNRAASPEAGARGRASSAESQPCPSACPHLGQPGGPSRLVEPRPSPSGGAAAAPRPAPLPDSGPYLRPLPEPPAPRPLRFARSPALRTPGGGRCSSGGGDAGSGRREATGAKPRGKRSGCAGSPDPAASDSVPLRCLPGSLRLCGLPPEARVGGAGP